MVADAGNDLAFFCVGVGGDGEVWAFVGSGDGFGGWCMRKWGVGWIDEGDGGGGELWLDWFRSDGGLDIVEGGVGFDGRRHGVVVEKCWWR